MALTDDQKARIRMFTGWQARWAQFDGALERGMNAIANDAAEETLALEHLAECVRIDAAIKTAEARLKAATVGSIDLNAKEIDQLRDRGRTAVGRLCRAFGIEARGDAFGPTLPSGRAGPFGPSGGGNAQRQG